VLPPGNGGHPPARGAHQQTQANQKRLGHSFDRFGFLPDRHGQSAQSHRAAAEAVHDRLQDSAIDPIQADHVHLIQLQSSPRCVQVDDAITVHLGPIPDPAQQPVGDPRSAAAPASDFRTALVRDVDVEQPRAAVHDAFEVGDLVEVEVSGEAESIS